MPIFEQAAAPLSSGTQMRQLSVHSLQSLEMPAGRSGCCAGAGTGASVGAGTTAGVGLDSDLGLGKFKISALIAGVMADVITDVMAGAEINRPSVIKTERRIPAPLFGIMLFLSMIFSENRFALFGIML